MITRVQEEERTRLGRHKSSCAILKGRKGISSWWNVKTMPCFIDCKTQSNTKLQAWRIVNGQDKTKKYGILRLPWRGRK